MDLSTVVDVLSIVAVVSGLIFAGIELRQFRISRERESALQLLSTYQSRDFMSGVRAITQLPDNQTKEQVEELAGERKDDIYFVLASFEGLGALVFKGELNLTLLEDFFSGIIVVAWSKLQRFVEDERRISGRETWLEWAQWLAERIIEREMSKPAIPAHVQYKDWKPN